MLEPLLMLTVLNCFFMFSSTVTTCALWWQYRRHREHCPTHGDTVSKLKAKEANARDNKSSKNDGKLSGKGHADCTGNKLLARKGEKSVSKSAKDCKKEKTAVSLGTPIKVSHQKALADAATNDERKTLEKLTSTEDMKHGATSPSSEAKSTIVMEVSTVQKVVQIIDGDRDQRYTRIPKETITYRLSPENERKVEFIVDGKSIDRT